MRYEIQSASARLPMMGLSLRQRFFSSSSSISKQPPLGLDAFVCFPDQDEIAHDHDHIAPALDILGAPLLFQREQRAVENIFLGVLAKMVTSKAVQALQHFADGLFVVLDAMEGVRVNRDAAMNLFREHFQLAG